MMKYEKYDGAGNSFMVADARTFAVLPETTEIIRICKKNHSDGMLILEKSEKYAYKMRYFNADGSEEFCGNGARVLAYFAHELGILDPKGGIFEAFDKAHEAKFEQGQWGIHMKDLFFSDIQPILNGYFLDTGVPHYVEETEILQDLDLIKIALPIRYNQVLFPKGINVNFYECKKNIHLRTYERGVEAETLACGTGATAVGLVTAYLYHKPSPIFLQAKGGLLKLLFNKKEDRFVDIWLFGPVKKCII